MLIFKRVGRIYSLRRNLLLLVLVCVLPVAFVSAALAFSLYQLRKDQVEQQTALLGHTVLADLEREMAILESALRILATSQELVSGNMAGFHQRARDALAPGIAYNYILTDPEGHQVVNTLVPYGKTLRNTGSGPVLQRVFSQKTTVLTDITRGPLHGKLAVAMGVPVVFGDRVAYSLNMGIDPARITAISQAHELPDGWLVAILDSAGNIVGRSRDAERYGGQPAMPEVREARLLSAEGRLFSETKEGVPVNTAFVNSKRWGWTVVVGAPRQALVQTLQLQLAWVLGGIALAWGLGLGLARLLSLRVLESLQQLNHAAIAAGHGEDVHLPDLRLAETEAVLTTVVQASQAMKQVKFLAQHDALTSLPNRLLFDEVAERSLALAGRQRQPLALLALDLDGFKGVNDTLGHAAGDLVLQTVAQRILQTIRASDIAARIGGDEFILLLTGVDASHAMDSAQRIIRVLSEPYMGVGVAVSASIGVAMFPANGATLKALVVVADRALYRAKDSGRRRAVLADIPDPAVSD